MNTRFSVAVHILTFLQTQKGEPATSELVASSVGTNASLIRRLTGQLIAAGLVSTQRGTGGGAVLGRPANEITLLDVHRAIDENADVIPIHQSANPKCPVGRHIQEVLEHRVTAVERAMEAELARSTIAALASDLTRRAQRQRA